MTACLKNLISKIKELVATTFNEIGIFIYKKIDLKTRKKPWGFRGFFKKEFFYCLF